jgi:hypothetical protein
MRRIPVLTSIAVLVFTVAVPGMTNRDPPVERAALFDLPMKRIQQLKLQQLLLSSVAQKRLDIAGQIAEQLTHLDPDEPTVWYNLACLQAVSGQTQPALKNLNTAVQRGFRDLRQLEMDADLQSLRSEAAFAEILKAAKEPFVPKAAPVFQPGRIANGVAMVTEQNTRWDNSRLSLMTSFEPLSPADSRTRIVGNSAAEVAVNGWLAEGTAAGHHGDLYDNRDRDHSNLNLAKFPQLVRVEYSRGASKADADWCIRSGQAFEQPTFGNSSTAQVGSPFWRSNPRMVMHDNLLMMLVYNQFVNNQMYCYPEHNDFDTTHGDVYPANTPFWVISQGSSGSDQPFLEAIALTLAAFRPEVKRTLVEKQMLMSTVQMLLRRSQKSVQTEEDYFSGKAHPVVFQSSELDPLRMVQLAHDLTLTSLPPVARLKVIREDLGTPGKDYFHPVPAERLFDTPAAIARVYRSTAFQRRMVVDAAESVDVNGSLLKFRWSVLQGDPNRVRIRPLNDTASRAEVTIEWHERTAIPGLDGMQTNRVDIGVFAISETATSLPAFVSSFTLANEKRIYNDQRLIESVDYGDAEVSRRYVDPVLDLPKNWRDEYHYDQSGALLGWTRTIPREAPQEFAADGRLVVRNDERGMPVDWREVRYEELSQNGQPSRLQQVVIDTAPAISK